MNIIKIWKQRWMSFQGKGTPGNMFHLWKLDRVLMGNNKVGSNDFSQKNKT